MFGTLCCLYRSSWAIMQNKSWKVVKKKKLNSRWMAHLCFVRGCEKRIMGVWGEHFMLSLLVKRRDFWAFIILFSFWIFFSTFCFTMNECKKRINKYGFFCGRKKSSLCFGLKFTLQYFGGSYKKQCQTLLSPFW